MRQTQAQKMLRSLLLFLCFYYVGSSQPSTNKSYRLTYDVTLNGSSLLFGKSELFVVDSFAFEWLYTYVGRSIRNLQPNGQFVVDKSTVVNKDSLTKYVVTDFKSGKCFVFSLSNPPKLIQTVPLSAKKKITGLSFEDEADPVEVGNNSKNFKHVADTVIGNFKYHILENTAGFTMQEIQCKRARAFLNIDLQQFPFHPISTQMDKLFGGIVTRIELYDTKNNTFITNYRFDTISNEKFAFINRYLKLAVK